MVTPVPLRTDAAALALEHADRLVLGTARDVHQAVARRAFTPWRRTSAAPIEVAHDLVAGGVYAAVGGALRVARHVMRSLGEAGIGGPVERGAVGRQVVSAVNGLIGDRLADAGDPNAIRMSVRHAAADVPARPAELQSAFPGATGRIAVLLHGLGENDDSWSRYRQRHGTTYAQVLTELGLTPVPLRANTGLHVSDNATRVCSLMESVVEHWPVPVTEVVLVGHSMGGLVLRAALAEAVATEAPWAAMVRDLVCLGAPHGGAALEKGVHLAARALALAPESRPFATILSLRSGGITDLRHGYLTREEWDGQDLHVTWGLDRMPLEATDGVRHHFVTALLGSTARHVFSRAVGDLLVREHSAAAAAGVADAYVHSLVSTNHFMLLNHPAVHAVLREWLTRPTDLPGAP